MATLHSSLTAQNIALDLSPDAFGELLDSSDFAGDAAELRRRMERDGYLFMRGLLGRDNVLEARRVVTQRLSDGGFLDPASDSMEAVASAEARMSFMPELAERNEALNKALYSGPMMQFFEGFLGGPIRHYDFTWFRAVAPGVGALPHCDVPYMGRGTHHVYTAWTPIGDVDFEQGGLIVLENSPQHVDLIRPYLQKDVDVYCVNGRNASDIEAGRRKFGDFDGVLSKNPVALRKKLGGRWLTTEFSAGDVLVFSVYTIHASLDNHSRRIRLSSDSRYQLAGEPVDDRWVGENPPGHGLAGKRGRVC
jgi:hypothetical protein